MKECVYCEGVADFQWLDGGWYVCTGCVKEGKTDTKGETEQDNKPLCGDHIQPITECGCLL
jgi:hypothetical protein